MNKIPISKFRLFKNRLLCFTRFYTSVSDNKKVCVIGSGPAGFYTAQQILRNCTAEVDIYEKLPVPFGLIRYGVAPDHPEIKVTTNTFTKVAEHERCQFFGNINVGQDVKLSELLDAYHAVVLAFGASKDKKLGIPGENSKNVLSARRFVNWYNGHPDHVEEKVNLDMEVATVVGHGNVALDVARILLRSTDELKSTDIAQHAMDALMGSRIKKVVLIGRRGPLQVAFTIKEFRQILQLKGINATTSIEDFEGISTDVLESLPRPKKRIIELACGIAKGDEKNSDRTLEFKFFRTPESIMCDEHGKVQKMVLGINTVNEISETAKVIKTSKDEELECGLVLRSVGYQCMPIDPLIPFDQTKYIVPNKGGRVIGQDGLYCSGWVKTGPIGVIFSTMNGSYETAETLMEDMGKEQWFFKSCSGSSTILELLKHRGVKFTTFNDWKEINKIEKERGQAVGKSRQKICSVKEMLQAANIV